jgi:tetratricopeptide (TPR) repeat protein
LFRGRAAVIAGAFSLLLLIVVVTQVTPPGDSGSAGAAAVRSAPLPASKTAVSPAKPEDAPGPGEDRADPKHGGTAAYSQGNFQLARERYQKAVEANPRDADALNNLGQVLARMGQPAEAIPYFDRALALYPDVWTYRFNRAHAESRLGNWREASEGYKLALALNADDYVIHYNLGMALHKLGDEEAAVAAYRRAIDLAPGEPTFRLSLGISYQQLNRPAEAAKAYEEYLQMSPSAPDAAQVRTQIETLRKPA